MARAVLPPPPQQRVNPLALPERPGVYLFKDHQHKVLYIGKAINLRRRVSQYFQGSQGDLKVLFFRPRIATVETIVTDTELEALVLEDSLIKQEKPLFNVRLKDDKTYPYVVVTNERYPRIFLTRTTRVKGWKYYGPFTDVGMIRQMMGQLQGVFRLRSCEGDIEPTYARPCLEYQIGRCPGPCIAAIEDADYLGRVKRFEAVLKGRTHEVADELTRLMKAAAEGLRFEDAQEFKMALQTVQRMSERQKVVSVEENDRDVIATVSEEDTLHIQLWKVRQGRLTEQVKAQAKCHQQTPEDALVHFILRYYPNAPQLPDELLLPYELPDGELLETWFRENLGKAVNLLVPKRGAKKELMTLVQENLSERLRQEMGLKSLRDLGMRQLQEILGMPQLPRTMEGYDISTLQGAFTVGARSYFKDGQPFKKGYRKYLIKTVYGQDDYRSLQEVLTRRIFPSGKKAPDPPPDILMIDGGLGQLSHAAEIIENAGFPTTLISLAKKEELIYVWGRKDPIRLMPGHSGLMLLIQLRDEVHRFAVTYHRFLRRRALVENFAALGMAKAATRKPGSLTQQAPRKLAEAMAEFEKDEAPGDNLSGEEPEP